MESGPCEDVFPILNMGIFQPAMLLYQRVYYFFLGSIADRHATRPSRYPNYYTATSFFDHRVGAVSLVQLDSENQDKHRVLAIYSDPRDSWKDGWDASFWERLKNCVLICLC